MRNSKSWQAFALCILATAIPTYSAADGVTSAEISTDCGLPKFVDLTPYPYNTSARGDDLPIELGRFGVPAVRPCDESGKHLEAGFLRFSSEGNDGQPPIVILTHESTQSTERYDFYSSLREFGDVIVFSARGTGWSSPVPPCSQRINYALDVALTIPALEQAMERYVEGCRAELEDRGLSTEIYDAEDVAGDLVDLVAALQIEKINLIADGLSTLPALAFVERHPGLVDKLVLVNLPLQAGDLGNRAVELLSSDDSHSSRHLAEALRTVAERLADQPANVVLRSSSGKNITLQVGALDVAFAVADVLTQVAADSNELASAILQARDGDYKAIAGLALLARKRISQPSVVSGISSILQASAVARYDDPLEFALTWPERVARPTAQGSEQWMISAIARLQEKPLVVNGRQNLYGVAALSSHWSRWKNVAILAEARHGSAGILSGNRMVGDLVRRYLAGESLPGYTITD